MKIKRIERGIYTSKFTKGKCYEVVSSDNFLWVIIDDRGNETNARKDSRFWEVVKHPEKPVKPEKPETRRISRVTRILPPYSGFSYTLGDCYRVLSQRGDKVVILDDEGKRKTFNPTRAKAWEVTYESEEPVWDNTDYSRPVPDPCVDKVKIGASEYLKDKFDTEILNYIETKANEEKPMKLSIENNVTLVNGTRADKISMDAYLSLIQEQKKLQERLESFGVSDVSAAVGLQITEHRNNIAKLVEVLDANYGKAVDTKDTGDNK